MGVDPTAPMPVRPCSSAPSHCLVVAHMLVPKGDIVHATLKEGRSTSTSQGPRDLPSTFPENRERLAQHSKQHETAAQPTPKCTFGGGGGGRANKERKRGMEDVSGTAMAA